MQCRAVKHWFTNMRCLSTRYTRDREAIIKNFRDRAGVRQGKVVCNAGVVSQVLYFFKCKEVTDDVGRRCV